MIESDSRNYPIEIPLSANSFVHSVNSSEPGNPNQLASVSFTWGMRKNASPHRSNPPGEVREVELKKLVLPYHGARLIQYRYSPAVN